MFQVSYFLRNTYLSSCLLLQSRCKSKTHWSKLKKKTGPKYKALNHFDDFYGSVFGDKWLGMREALLRRSKYVALVNNYGDADKTMEFLSNRGAHDLRKLMLLQQEHHNQYTPTQTKEPTQTQSNTDKLESYMAKLQIDEISSVYPQGQALPDRLEVKDVTLGSREVKKQDAISIPERTLDESIAEADIDTSRIIDPSLGITAESLYQYIPATQLKGMDEWIPESLHYSYYSKDMDFPLIIEPETEFNFPEHLKVFTYEMDSDENTFPEPRRCSTGVYNYYPMDCGSILPVLALGLSPGDRVFDMCAAPGGKTLVALQTLLPDIIICNDTSISRNNRLQRVFKDYLYDFETNNKWRERVLFTRVDGRRYLDELGFDKVLVDVPCTTDRVSVMEDENNIFRPDRVKERLRIPEMQSQLLINALKLVKVGGSVVYSTCSLSPIQNDGVVHLALKHAFHTHHIVAAVRDLTQPLAGLSSTLNLGTDAAAPKYGQLVVPSVAANFGPSYLAKLVRIK